MFKLFSIRFMMLYIYWDLYVIKLCSKNRKSCYSFIIYISYFIYEFFFILKFFHVK